MKETAGLPRTLRRISALIYAALPWTHDIPREPITLIDSVRGRSRRIDDLVLALGGVIGVGLLSLIAVYGHATSLSVAADFSQVLNRFLVALIVVPMRIIENIFTLIVPLIILVMLGWKRQWNTIVQAFIAGIIALGLTPLYVYLMARLAPPVVESLSVINAGTSHPGLNASIAGLSAFLTVAGRRRNERTLSWSWTALWLLVAVTILQGRITLPGAIITILIGRVVGNLTRYSAGIEDLSPQGGELIAGIHRAGFTPVTVVRLDPPSPPGELYEMQVDVTETAPESGSSLPYARQLCFHTAVAGPVIRAEVDRRYQLPRHLSSGRLYRTYIGWDKAGNRRLISVIDPDRRVWNMLRNLWTNLHLRDSNLATAPSLRRVAQQAVLMLAVARDAGITVPRVHGFATASQSVLFVVDGTEAGTPLSEIAADPRRLGRALDNLWQVLRRAHTAGIAHRNLDTDTVFVNDQDDIRILGWSRGEAAASELVKRVDLVQALILSARLAGPARAVEIARLNLGPELVASLAPLLQDLAVPYSSRIAVRREGIIPQLRTALTAGDAGEASTAKTTFELSRIPVKRVALVVVGVVAATVVVGSLNFNAVRDAVATANPVWFGVAFGLGLVTYFGSALTLVALSPKRVSVREATLVQVAASVVSLVAPAGIGPAALNLRYLSKRDIPTSVGLATVGLVQVFQFLVTVTMLLITVLITGQSASVTWPSGELLVIFAIIAIVIFGLTLIPAVRGWVWRKARPSVEQVWPRVLWVIENPRRITIAVIGVVIQTASFVAAFGASLAAFGYTLNVGALAVTFLTANSLGSVIPSPGGLGPVEAALTGGLQLAGIPLAVAVSTAVLYRLVTFWARVPIGWVALRIMEKRQLI